MHNKTIICLCLTLTLTLQSAAFGQEPEPAGKTGDSSVLHTGLAVTGGCVGGAVLGTVVPIFGNLVGCALGGIAGWWFGRKESPNTPEAAQPSSKT